MTYYLVHFELQDGEHEHAYKYLATANSDDELRRKIDQEQVYECGDEAPETSRLSFGDGLTAMTSYWFEPIPELHYQILKQYLGEL